MSACLKTIGAVLILAVLAGAGIASAGDGRVTVKPAPAENGWTIGDPVVFQVTLDYPSGTKPPVLVRQFPESVALIDETSGEKKTDRGRVSETRSLRLAFFQTGEVSTGPIRYTGERPGGVIEFRAEALKVKIQPLRPDKDDQPDAPEPPWVIPYPTLKLVGLIAGSLLLLAGVVWLVWHLLRRRRAGLDEVVIPPHLEARDRLQALAGQDLPRQGRLREFYFAVTEIVKDYLGKELEIVVLERTTREILDQLPAQPALTDKSRELVGRFLLSGDPVKFARRQPPASEVDEYLRTAFDIVHQVHGEAEACRRQAGTAEAEKPPAAEEAAS